MKKSNLFFICCILIFTSAVTTLVSPADPTDIPSLIDYTTNAGTNPGGVSATNGLASTRAHDITLTADVSTCTTSMSLDCEVNAGDAKVLNLTNFMNGAILIQ